MNRNVKKRTIIIMFLFVILSGLCGLYQIFDPLRDQGARYPSEIHNNVNHYRIDPETIIASLDRGETNVFMQALATPEIYTLEGFIPPWNQSDYLKIANALHQFVWNESLDNWNLFRMVMDITCQDIFTGFASGDFVYFQTVWEQGKIKYAVRQMIIHPLYNEVSSGGTSNFRHPAFGWKGVNLSSLKVTAENVLSIAENNGGKDARLVTQNDCKIHVILSPELGYEGWYVRYEWYKTLLELQIDPYSGRVIKREGR